ncbi:mitotic checkpoint protein bub3 [Lichtheimia corymbifera JMRC:FSU:9682]|uniref:Mitotic checkpoint protein bub3 n=1 Tax=Lichtheimia corymbifera JMRC:FSU:9682 TaxID=1263082 RepID=A0A068S6A9_9FUNG|nr:mitotic checkpoint protein bub3 [Lichtheimia corymbifera JMRC:FSU:9682]
MQDPTTQFEIADPPSDGISSVTFNPSDSRFLLATSWDTTVRLYDVELNEKRAQFDNKGAVLDACFAGIDVAYSGGLDRQIKMLNLENKTEQVIGSHDEAVRCLCWSSETNSVYSGSWDKTLRVWDSRSSEAQQLKHQLPEKVFSMDLNNNRLVVAMANREIHVYDIRNMNEPEQQRMSSLRYMLKCVRCMPDGQGYACSSIEGRVALEYFDAEAQSKKYAFKSHRQVINDTEVVYPVNALAFHPIYGTFASGGSDCVVSIWDGVNRKRIKQFQRYPDEISSLSFSPDGKMLAVASSYTFDEGERDHSPDAIFIKHIGENECKPRHLSNGGNS